MNTINNQQALPHMPTEIWEKIYDVKDAMEIVDMQKSEHKSQLRPVLADLTELFGLCTTNSLPSQLACDCCKEQCTEMLPPDSNGGYGYFHDMTKYGVCETCINQLWEQHLYSQPEAVAFGSPGHIESYDEFIDDMYDGVYFNY